MVKSHNKNQNFNENCWQRWIEEKNAKYRVTGYSETGVLSLWRDSLRKNVYNQLIQF